MRAQASEGDWEILLRRGVTNEIQAQQHPPEFFNFISQHC